MISKGENKFNCCESTLIRIDRERELPGFGPDAMRIASCFGGGVAGWGSVCGAVSGAVMALGLLYGTNGGEEPEEFSKKRTELRDLSQSFLKAFEEKWGSVNCMDLLGVDRRTEEGKKRYEELRAQGAFHCGDYVEWAADKILEMLDS